MWHICHIFTVEHHLTQHFFPIFQFDLPFVEVHRVKAFRFSLPSSKEEEEHGETVEPSSVISEAEIGYGESKSRTGSQTRLTEKSSGREMTDKQKTPDSLLCGLCCATPPAVSVWNCDGEILPVTEVFCRWAHSQNSEPKQYSLLFICLFVCFLIALTTSFQNSWPVVTTVCPGHRGPGTAQLQ